MSEGNIETLRGGLEHFQATGQLLDQLYDPDFVWDMSTFRGWPERQVYAGVEGVREFLSAWLSTWDDWEMEIEELLDGGEKVIAILRQRGRSKESGVTVEMRFAQVWTFRDGKFMRMQMYADPSEALEAVGLGEPG